MSKKDKKPKIKKLPFDARILDGLPDPVFAVDRGYRIVDANRAALDLFGPNAVGLDFAASQLSDPILETVKTVLEGTGMPRSEVEFPSPVSRTYELNLWRLPGLKSTGPAWVIVVLHDMTALRRAEQMRADFVSNVSHEMRSPLSSLLGFIETLRGPAQNDPEATDRFLRIMEDEAKRMTRLINDLLILSKVEAGEHILPEGKVNLGDLITQVANILSVRAIDRNMEITIEQAKTAVLAKGDPDELVQVFQNLVSNAISYGREGTPVQLNVTAVNELPDIGGPGVSVAVTNQGDGIPAEDIPRLTERFYRVDKGRSRTMGGTGLGLAIVKHIVARHRGALDIQSTPGKDTCLTVYLPAAEG
ncbi:MAG: PAS domain-containing protein [Alphaproteobacteria bacterium]|jgi:two-component system, OmpR family, phosphate regulon sensor histidine kinase PhoR|nr:PAS domain-containing protein [Alphaproteobacteria bacterium]MBT7943371.1 PAS domain-containing protein [Alphaproteobacteria bacterium]